MYFSFRSRLGGYAFMYLSTTARWTAYFAYDSWYDKRDKLYSFGWNSFNVRIKKNSTSIHNTWRVVFESLMWECRILNDTYLNSFWHIWKCGTALFFLYVYNTFYSLLYAETGKVLTQSRNRLETHTSITTNVYRLQLLDLGADINDTHRNAGTILRFGIWRFSEAWWKQCHQNNIGLPLNVMIDTPYWILVKALFHGKCGCDFKSTNFTKT